MWSLCYWLYLASMLLGYRVFKYLLSFFIDEGIKIDYIPKKMYFFLKDGKVMSKEARFTRCRDTPVETLGDIVLLIKESGFIYLGNCLLEYSVNGEIRYMGIIWESKIQKDLIFKDDEDEDEPIDPEKIYFNIPVKSKKTSIEYVLSDYTAPFIVEYDDCPLAGHYYDMNGKCLKSGFRLEWIKYVVGKDREINITDKDFNSKKIVL